MVIKSDIYDHFGTGSHEQTKSDREILERFIRTRAVKARHRVLKVQRSLGIAWSRIDRERYLDVQSQRVRHI